MQSDNGTKYTNKKFMHLCEEHGIHRHFSISKTPQLNGVAEKMNWTLAERRRCLRLNVGLSKVFLAATLNMACYLVNKSPWASLDGNIAEEVRTGNPIDLSNLRIFRCLSYMHISSENGSKLDPK